MAFHFGPEPYVQIGTQKWQRYNLDVNTYRNGDIIPQVTDPTQWQNLTTGAWCWYNNDPALGKIYGKLYNWYAVNDPRGLAPLGWHVSTDEEWTTLETTLNGSSVAGGALKQTGTSLWQSPNTGATNSSGFTALPGGFRGYGGSFFNVGYNGAWWSASEYDTTTAWYRYLYYNDSYIDRDAANKGYGSSVRCLKN